MLAQIFDELKQFGSNEVFNMDLNLGKKYLVVQTNMDANGENIHMLYWLGLCEGSTKNHFEKKILNFITSSNANMKISLYEMELNLNSKKIIQIVNDIMKNFISYGNGNMCTFFSYSHYGTIQIKYLDVRNITIHNNLYKYPEPLDLGQLTRKDYFFITH